MQGHGSYTIVAKRYLVVVANMLEKAHINVLLLNIHRQLRDKALNDTFNMVHKAAIAHVFFVFVVGHHHKADRVD